MCQMETHPCMTQQHEDYTTLFVRLTTPLGRWIPFLLWDDASSVTDLMGRGLMLSHAWSNVTLQSYRQSLRTKLKLERTRDDDGLATAIGIVWVRPSASVHW